MFHTDPLKVTVAIPHFFRESSFNEYGSSRSNNKFAREFSFYNCLSSLLALGDSQIHNYLDLARTCLVPFSCKDHISGPIDIKIHVFITHDYCLSSVLEHFGSRLELHCLTLDDPRLLPSHASNYLLDNDFPTDISYYSEDDLVIRDAFFFFKQFWFTNQTNNQFVLMPHRFEQCIGGYPNKLFVDGPNQRLSNSSSKLQQKNFNTERICASGIDPLTKTKIDFVLAQNPHSGSYTLSNNQIIYLQERQLKPKSFISPLETAATGSIYPHFTTVKPAWCHAWFLQIQHDNPSFLSLLNKWSAD